MERITLTPAQKRARRGRNIALGFVLFGLVALFYIVTIVKFSSGMAQ